MGKVEQALADILVDSVPDRNANRIRVYRKAGGDLVIHFRNFKWMLIGEEEQREWVEGFTKALAELRRLDILKNDI